ncbi:MAG: glycosyltransferase family 4 protein [Pseudomonadota bacterium]
MSLAPLYVTHVFRSLDPHSGGPLTYLEGLRAALDASAVRIQSGCVLACAPPAMISPLAHAGTAGRSDAANAMAFGRWLRRSLADCDLVHIHGPFGWQFLIAVLLCRQAGCPYVVSSHGLLSAWYLSQRRWLKSLYLLLAGPLLRRAAALVAMTEQEADFLRVLDPRLRVQVAMPGLPIAPLPAAPPAGALHILFVGRLSRVKGLPELLQALARLRAGGLDARLDIAGDTGRDYGPDRLRADIASLALGDSVTWHGFVQVPQRQLLLQRTHVFALPSYSENFSYVTAEALAAGVPAVVTDAVGMADLIRRYRCGSVIPVGNADALAQALAEYRDPGLRQDRARQARICAEQELSLAAMGRTMEALYKNCAQATPT